MALITQISLFLGLEVVSSRVGLALSKASLRGSIAYGCALAVFPCDLSSMNTLPWYFLVIYISSSKTPMRRGGVVRTHTWGLS